MRCKIPPWIRNRLRNQTKESELRISFQGKKLTKWPELTPDFQVNVEHKDASKNIIIIITNNMNKSYLSALQLNPWKSHPKKSPLKFQSVMFKLNLIIIKKYSFFWRQKCCNLILKLQISSVKGKISLKSYRSCVYNTQLF